MRDDKQAPSRWFDPPELQEPPDLDEFVSMGVSIDGDVAVLVCQLADGMIWVLTL